MITKAAEVRAALHKAFKRLGVANGHNLPEGSDNRVDPVLHSLYIAAEGASYFKKKADELKKTIKKDYEDDIKLVEPSTKSVLESGNNYELLCERRAAPKKKEISRKLLLEMGVSLDKIEKATVEVTGTSAVVLTVIGKS